MSLGEDPTRFARSELPLCSLDNASDVGQSALVSGSAAKPVLTIDGSRFSDFAGFTHEFSKLLQGYTWNGNLDAFNDILRGGFGTPENGFVLRWLHAETSREALGPNRFLTVIEIIKNHGPGGTEAEDGVELELT